MTKRIDYEEMRRLGIGPYSDEAMRKKLRPLFASGQLISTDDDVRAAAGLEPWSLEGSLRDQAKFAYSRTGGTEAKRKRKRRLKATRPVKRKPKPRKRKRCRKRRRRPPIRLTAADRRHIAQMKRDKKNRTGRYSPGYQRQLLGEAFASGMLTSTDDDVRVAAGLPPWSKERTMF